MHDLTEVAHLWEMMEHARPVRDPSPRGGPG